MLHWRFLIPIFRERLQNNHFSEVQRKNAMIHAVEFNQGLFRLNCIHTMKWVADSLDISQMKYLQRLTTIDVYFRRQQHTTVSNLKSAV